ncbi:PHB depolymerase family esterase [Azoarcus sp. KH32C]|uniref:extracellular catalytic domain type 1 short-chain-length polyhydroxyalkanoate depolymerase n=1 Tax=Azoarcus sp. KH32C TaxID=748247 RepID=UPI0002386BE5|nr:PHB depolymerase family esterase [Azoarcus sp. KH32C]BAL26550.1 esterase, poly(3-hydroxybutyrate) depolymerase [Azoarcus sp. KH32C]
MKIANDLLGRLLQATPLRDATLPIHRFDARSVADTIERALESAGLNSDSGPMKGVRDTIRQALGAGMNAYMAPPSARGMTIDGVAREVFGPQADEDGAGILPTRQPEPALPGEFVTRSFANEAGARSYKLYVPARYSRETARMPLMVMLHGCTQSPDDFAAGTRMNALAEEHGFLVAYPAQAPNANGSKCWNWFRAEDQKRDRGEPSLIAGITREVAKSHRVDERRIFVAGLSAGAAMAVILGTLYPDLYAAVGAHSGLPFGAAHDLPSAFAAMSGGAGRKTNGTARGVPTVVFHGDQDRTVSIGNGAAIVEQAAGARQDAQPLRASVHKGAAPGGRTHSRTIYADAAGQPVVEQWVLHGAGHAWSGGSPHGSYTDGHGPDASAEMIRFFLSLPRAGSA